MISKDTIIKIDLDPTPYDTFIGSYYFPSNLSLIYDSSIDRYKLHANDKEMNLSQFYSILSSLSSSEEVFQTIFAACYLTNKNILNDNYDENCLLNDEYIPKSNTRLKDWFYEYIIQPSEDASMVYNWIFSRSSCGNSMSFTDTINHMIDHGHMGIFPGIMPLVYLEESRYASILSRWSGFHSIFTFHNWLSAKYFGIPFGGGKYPYGRYRHPYSYWDAHGSYYQITKEHKKRINVMVNSISKNWCWDSFGKANVEKLNKFDIWHMFEPSSNKKSYQWLNAQRCFSEIMTGLTCPNLTNAKNKPQIICARPMNVPPSSDSDNKTQDSLEKGKCAIIKTGSSINLVVPIGIEIGNYTTLIKRSSFSSTNCSSQFN